MPHPDDLLRHAQELRRQADHAEREAAEIRKTMEMHDDHIRHAQSEIQRLAREKSDAEVAKSRVNTDDPNAQSEIQQHDRKISEANQEILKHEQNIQAAAGEKTRLTGKTIGGLFGAI
jgi:chromosome segregation ATPase